MMQGNDGLNESSSAYSLDATFRGALPNLVLRSTDSVLFYVHFQVLQLASNNEFGKHIPLDNPDGPIAIPEDSQTLTIILDVIYRNPNAAVEYAPPYPFSRLAAAIHRLPLYGVNLEAQLDLDQPSFVLEDSSATIHPLFISLKAHAETNALDLYILAAQHSMEKLAIWASMYLVGFRITDLSDEDADAMGSRYLKRLMLLQVQREDALKRILLQPPYPHTSTPECDAIGQKALMKAWAFLAVSFSWEIRPDLPSAALERLLSPLAAHVACELCRQSIQEQVTKIVNEWENVKRTI